MSALSFCSNLSLSNTDTAAFREVEMGVPVFQCALVEEGMKSTPLTQCLAQ